MQVKGFKDVSGQEFIAEVVNITNESLTIKNPLCLVPTEKGMMPVPYIMSSTKELVIDKSNLIFKPFDIEDEIANFYKQKFGGIVEAPTGLIL